MDLNSVIFSLHICALNCCQSTVGQHHLYLSACTDNDGLSEENDRETSELEVKVVFFEHITHKQPIITLSENNIIYIY